MDNDKTSCLTAMRKRVGLMCLRTVQPLLASQTASLPAPHPMSIHINGRLHTAARTREQLQGGGRDGGKASIDNMVPAEQGSMRSTGMNAFSG